MVIDDSAFIKKTFFKSKKKTFMNFNKNSFKKMKNNPRKSDYTITVIKTH